MGKEIRETALHIRTASLQSSASEGSQRRKQPWAPGPQPLPTRTLAAALRGLSLQDSMGSLSTRFLQAGHRTQLDLVPGKHNMTLLYPRRGFVFCLAWKKIIIMQRNQHSQFYKTGRWVLKAEESWTQDWASHPSLIPTCLSTSQGAQAAAPGQPRTDAPVCTQRS